MGDAAAPHGFRPASSADPTMLRHWISTPEVVHWRGDLDEQYDMLDADLYEPGIVMHIVTHDGRPFAYAQRYAEHIWPQPHFAALPAAARAIDDLIGAPDMFGAGHGSAFLRQLAALLIAEGAPLVAIDPDEAGLRQGRIRRLAGGMVVVAQAASSGVIAQAQSLPHHSGAAIGRALSHVLP